MFNFGYVKVNFGYFINKQAYVSDQRWFVSELNAMTAILSKNGQQSIDSCHVN